MARILIFTGKGGVGKSSISSAHAIRSAREGKKTILVSTDRAHNLADIFERKIGREVTNIEDCLDAIELDPETIMRQDYSNFMEAITKLLASPGIAVDGGEQTFMFPGLEELFSLLKIADLEESGEYDRIIVDCAPTGETLALLKFPELLGWYMEKLFPVGRMAVRVLAPIARSKYKIDLPDAKGMNDIEKLYARLINLQKLLKDPERTSVRIVAIPEKMVVEETKRSFMYLNLYGYHVDGIYINRILPEGEPDDFFAEWRQIQKVYRAELEEVFANKPIYPVPWYETDLRGESGIARISEDALRDERIFDVIAKAEGEFFEKVREGYRLTIPIPLAQKGDLHLSTNGHDVILRLGNYKRSIPLPTTLTAYEISSAKLEDGRLRIRFASASPSDAQQGKEENV